jgi:hypothetical protein
MFRLLDPRFKRRDAFLRLLGPAFEKGAPIFQRAEILAVDLHFKLHRLLWLSH